MVNRYFLKDFTKLSRGGVSIGSKSYIVECNYLGKNGGFGKILMSQISFGNHPFLNVERAEILFYSNEAIVLSGQEKPEEEC